MLTDIRDNIANELRTQGITTEEQMTKNMKIILEQIEKLLLYFQQGERKFNNIDMLFKLLRN